MAPLVSTIIPVHNRPAMLRHAVESVIAQTHRPIEIVIVDDGSTDATGSVADDLAEAHPEVTVIHKENRGPGAAREAARGRIRGDYVQHLDSDDLLLPRKFEVQIAALEGDPAAGAAYGWTRRIDSTGAAHPEPWKRSGERIATMFPAMLQSRWWDTPTPLYRASLIRRAGSWLPLRIEEDWEYDCRIAATGVRLAHVADWVCEVRVHEEGHLSAHGLRPEILRDRAEAHTWILEHARAAGIGTVAPEMRHFARELFLLARQCGAAGLTAESQALFDLARDASGTDRDRLQFRLYHALAAAIGWSAAGRVACFTDRLRW